MVSIKYDKIEGDEKLSPIIFIHTIPLDRTYMTDSINKVENTSKRTMYIIDLPSHGESDDIDIEILTFKEIILELHNLKKELKLEKFILYGHGVGGFFVLLYTLRYPSHVDALILSNSAVNAAYRETMAWNIRSNLSNAVKEVFLRMENNKSDKSIRMKFTQGLASYFYPPNAQAAIDLMDQCTRIGTEAYVILSHYEIPKYNVRETARSIKQPTLVLGGAYDVWPIKDIKKIVTDITQGELRFFPTGHFPMIEQTEKYWGYIFKWINENVK